MYKLLIVISLLVLVSCNEKRDPNKKLSFVVTNYPVYWLVETISGKSVDIIYNVPEDIDPAFWEPKDSDITVMQKADLILLNGATYEKWLNSVELPSSKTVNTSKDCREMFITIKDAEIHEHNGVKHSHDGTDFNIWLDTYLFSKQADTVLNQLIKLKPEMAEEFKKNHQLLVAEVKSVFMEINKVTVGQKQFIASNPVYDYLARTNGWQLKSFDWGPETMPSDEEWGKLKNSLAHSKYMLFEEVPSMVISEKLKYLGVKVIVFRTAGNTPPTKDFIKEMKNNLENLKKALNP